MNKPVDCFVQVAFLLRVNVVRSMRSKKNFTPFEKGQIWALHKYAHWPLQRIADALGCTKPAISRIIPRLEREVRTSQHRRSSPVIIFYQWPRLIQMLVADSQARQPKPNQIVRLKKLRFDAQTIWTTLAGISYSRYVAAKKVLVEETKQTRPAPLRSS